MLTPDRILRPRCGDTLAFRVMLTRDRAPMSLDGVMLTFTVKRSTDDADAAAVIVKRSGEGITHGPVTGEALVLVTADESRALGAGETYYWDLQTVDSGGNVFTPDGLFGRIIQLPDVTKATQ